MLLTRRQGNCILSLRQHAKRTSSEKATQQASVPRHANTKMIMAASLHPYYDKRAIITWISVPSCSAVRQLTHHHSHSALLACNRGSTQFSARATAPTCVHEHRCQLP